MDAKAQFFEATLNHRLTTETTGSLLTLSHVMTVLSTWSARWPAGRRCRGTPRGGALTLPARPFFEWEGGGAHRLPFAVAVMLVSYGGLIYLLFSLQHVIGSLARRPAT